METTVVRYSEKPGLWEDRPNVWPEYNRHGDVLNLFWGRLPDEFPECQFVLLAAREGDVLAFGHAAPCAWDGTVDGLGDGIDEMIAAAFDARVNRVTPTALCALAAEITPRYQGQGLAARVLDSMAAIARASGLQHLIAPVRPSLKDRYPLVPIDRYAHWRRDDGDAFDPWIRTHTRRGGRIVKPVPRSLKITGTISEWERWTDMRFPDDGEYVFPQGLAPLTINHAQDLGSYWEPSVWIVHATGG
jgi:GNAT superfamily N-acetyltransferase